MKRIVIHWTAGGYKPNRIDLKHYHFLIDNEGYIHNGNYNPEDNENCYDNRYAEHTGGGNTGSIGVAFCGMLDYSIGNLGHYPLNKKQMEAGFKLIAELCKKYDILIMPDTVLTHYEFGKSHPKSSSAGKIDINFIPYLPDLKPNEVGAYIRNKVKWYYGNMNIC